MKSGSDLYEILGVSPSSEPIVIEAAYRALMRQYQPQASKSQDAASKVQRINAAYSTLSSPRKRALYDAGLKATTDAEPGPADNSAPSVSKTAPALAPQRPAESEHMATVYVEETDSDRRLGSIILTVIAVIFVISIIASINGTNSSNEDALNAAVETNIARPAVNQAVENKAEEATPVVLDDKIAFSNPANCEADPSLENAFQSLLPMSDGRPLEPRQVQIGDLQLNPKLDDYVRADDPPGTIAKLSSVRLPHDATWHGLRASRLIASYYAQPETDSSYSRSITFRANPDEVRQVLTSQGFNPPSAGEYTRLNDNACGGSMELIPVTGGTELKCSWGC